MRQHHYALEVEWTGSRGHGTTGYREYGREHVVRAAGKAELAGSADRTFHGDADRWNPEELLLAALSQCHMLSYLHACVMAGVVVTGYTDAATGRMATEADGSGRFTGVALHPRVVLADESQRAAADHAHHEAHRMCFIANSVNFPVDIEPVDIEPVAP